MAANANGSSRRATRQRKRKGLSASSPEGVALRADLSQLGTAEEIATWYANNDALREAQIGWFHAVFVSARAERIGGLERYCQDLWQATWREPLTHDRYMYLAYGKGHEARRQKAYASILEEQAADPSLSTLAVIDMVRRQATEVIQQGLERHSSNEIANRHVDEASMTAALKLFGKVLQARMRLDAYERGYVVGPRGRLMLPSSGVKAS